MTSGALETDPWRSLAELPARELEEHVLQRGGAVEESRLGQLGQDRPGPSGIAEEPIYLVASALDVIGRARQSLNRLRAGCRRVGAAWEQLYDLGADVLGDEIGRRPAGNDVAMVHDQHAIAELGRFVHVMRRKEHRDAGALERAQLLPDDVAR